MTRIFTLLFLLLFSVQVQAAIIVYGVSGNPSTAYTTPSSAIASPNVRKVIITSPYTVTTAITIPSTVDLEFDNGGYIIFSGAGALIGLKETRPEWFGATGLGDDTVAVQAAVTCARANTGGGKVLLSKKYNVSHIDISSASADFTKRLIIEGIGNLVSGFVGTDNTKIVVDTIGTNYVTLKDMSITGTGTVGLLRARSTVSGVSSQHTSNNLRVQGNFSIAAVAAIASESNADYDMWFETTNVAGRSFATSISNEFGIVSSHGTLFTSSNTDNRMYGGFIQHYQNNAVVVEFVNSAAYTFYNVDIGNGEATGGAFVQYRLTSGFGNNFFGPVKWNDCLFEGGGPPGVTPSTTIIHSFKGNTGVLNSFYFISSSGGYYNIYPDGLQTIVTGDTTGSTTYLWINSDFTQARFNPTGLPQISLYAAEEVNIDLNSFANTTLTFTGYQGPGSFSATTINYAPNNNRFRPYSFGTAIPTTGTYGVGHIVWNTSAGTISEGVLGWQCFVAGTPGTWVPISVVTYGLPAYANNAAALGGGLTTGRIYRNGDILQVVH